MIPKPRIPIETTYGTDVPGGAAALVRAVSVAPVGEVMKRHPLETQAWDLLESMTKHGAQPAYLDDLTRALTAALNSTGVGYGKPVAAPVPMFVLRPSDRLAPFAVMTWAKDAELHGVATDKVVGAQKIAFKMIEWQQKHGCKVPD